MIEVEIQNLTAAIKELVEVLRNPPKFAVSLEAKEESEADKADRINRNDDAAREALQAERERRQAELDQQMAEVYKAEQAKTKRKAKVTPEETKALVEASMSALTNAPITMGGSGASDPAPEPEVVSDITETDLKTLAMEIARADSSARNIILSILGEHGSKTITHLDPKHYRAVHGKLMTLAHDIAKEGAPF